ncbi:MAG TPA: GntR family transcriptional regulator [Usitatibacter sp.]|nr:GntR family transcriptional regulator [Usitatibacter sp.]
MSALARKARPAEPAGATPAYQRIRDALRRRIDAGEYREGDRLPSESELVEEFSVARMTVRQALAQLVFESLIVRSPGRGSYVAPRKARGATIDSASPMSFEEQMSAQGRTPALKLLAFERTRALPEVARRLKVPRGAYVWRLERLRYVDDQLTGLEIRHIVDELGKRMPRAGIERTSTFDLLEAALGGPLDTVDVSMFAAAADAGVAAKLGIRRGAPILVREHVALDAGGRVVLYGHSIYRGELRFQHVFRRSTPA